MHSRPFQACFHHHLVATLYHPTPDWPALRLKCRILHLRLTLLEIGQVFAYTWYVQVGSCKAAQLGQQNACSILLELMQLLYPPGGGCGRVFAQYHISNLADPLSRVWEVQNPHRFWTVVIHKALDPFCPIVYRRNLLDPFEPSTCQFAQTQA